MSSVRVEYKGPRTPESSRRIDTSAHRKRKLRRIRLSPSSWANKTVRVKDGNKGKVIPISFGERRYLQKIYDTSASKRLLLSSRQSEKSTTLGNILLMDAILNQLHTSLFVTPSAMQTQVFSRTRIDDIIQISPLLNAMTHKSLTMNLLEKQFITGSRIYLRYAYLSADRSRGLTANSLYCDEIQDLLQEVMPVLEETTSHFDNPRFLYSGTPKTFNNTIERYWSGQSTMNEWAVPCEHHGTPNNPSSWHWNILGPDNLGKTGPICDKCGNPLRPDHPLADWVSTNTKRYDTLDGRAPVEGFRICRLMVPWFWKNKDKWAKMLVDRDNSYSIAAFMNEVMALSYDEGIKPLSPHHIEAVSNPQIYNEEEQVDELALSHQLWGGVDWGEGASANKAHTVFSVGGYTRADNNFQIVFSKRFTGELTDPDKQVDWISERIERWNLKLVGTDYGGGFAQNRRLTNRFGATRIRQYQYSGRTTSKVVFNPKLLRYIMFRSPVMADVFNMIRNQLMWLPEATKYAKPYAEDMLSIVSEYSDTLKMLKYEKIDGASDDTFHSVLYCFFVSLFDIPRPDIILPLQREESPVDQMAAELEMLAIEDERSYL